jgi:hypothetical protein
MTTNTTAGLTEIAQILSALEATADTKEYVFCSLPEAVYGELAAAQPLACMTEPEGLSLVLERSQAEHYNLPYDGVFRCITLGVHSSLNSVGLTAAVSAELAGHQISANLIAGTYHDHILVPAADADHALKLLHNLSANAQSAVGS